MIAIQKTACPTCGQHVEYPIYRQNEVIDCPSCAQPFSLPPPAPTTSAAQAIKTTRASFWGTICRFVGACIALPSGLFVVASLATFSRIPEKAQGMSIMMLAFFIGLTGVGMFFLRTGTRLKTTWVCSHCGNAVANQQVLLCPTCQAHLSQRAPTR